MENGPGRMANRELPPGRAAIRLRGRSLEEKAVPKTISTKPCAQEALNGEIEPAGRLLGQRFGEATTEGGRERQNFRDPSWCPGVTRVAEYGVAGLHLLLVIVFVVAIELMTLTFPCWRI